MADLILVVDDNATNAKLVHVLLTRGGFDVEIAGNVEDARAVLARRRPRLILLDLQLPGTDGFAFATELKARDDLRAIPIVAVTAYAMRGDDARARRAGCDGYFTKPIDTRTFLASLGPFLSSGGGPAPSSH